MQERERQGGVAAGERLEVQIGRAAVSVRTGSTTITRPGDSGSQWSWGCGAEAEGFAPQTRIQAESRRRARVEALIEVPYT